jgi:hypothetical protein
MTRKLFLITILILSLIFIFSTTFCGNGDEETETGQKTDEDKTTEEKDKTDNMTDEDKENDKTDKMAGCDNWAGDYVNENIEGYEGVSRYIILDENSMSWKEFYQWPDGEISNESSGKLEKDDCNFTLLTGEYYDDLMVTVEQDELTLIEGKEKVTFEKGKYTKPVKVSKCDDWAGEYTYEKVEGYEDVTRHLVLYEDMTWKEYYKWPDGETSNESSGKLEKDDCNFTLLTGEYYDDLKVTVEQDELTLIEGKDKITFQK